NAVGSTGFTEEENNIRLAHADKKIAIIIKNLKEGITGSVERTSIFEDRTIIRQFPNLMSFLFKLIFKGAKSFSFTVMQDCISCNQCINICPINNIEWVNGKH